MNVISDVGLLQIMKCAVGGLAIGIVASLIFSCNFRLWNKFESDRRLFPQLICGASYFLNLSIFFLTVWWVIVDFTVFPSKEFDLIALAFFAALPFLLAIRTGFIPKRNNE